MPPSRPNPFRPENPSRPLPLAHSAGHRHRSTKELGSIPDDVTLWRHFRREAIAGPRRAGSASLSSETTHGHAACGEGQVVSFDTKDVALPPSRRTLSSGHEKGKTDVPSGPRAGRFRAFPSRPLRCRGMSIKRSICARAARSRPRRDGGGYRSGSPASPRRGSKTAFQVHLMHRPPTDGPLRHHVR